MIRSAGILMPVSALPSEYGIGTLGEEAEKFIDFLAESGQTYWQILPTGPTGFGNSPYQSLSSFAGSHYLIDLKKLIEQGLLEKKKADALDWGKDPEEIDYGKLYNHRLKVLRKACARLALKHPEDYLRFITEEKSWLYDYAVFMAIKEEQKGAAWHQWPAELRNHKSEAVRKEAERLKDEVVFWQRVQYLFYTQMKEVKAYAEKKGIQIIADLPFYVAADSIDVWSHPEQFELDGEYRMTYCAGMPGGQKWGNPLFRFDQMRNDNYSWWIERCMHQFRFADVLRIDHFRGFESYYAVDMHNDAHSHWRKGPGLEIFRRLEEKAGKRQMILEDLGELTPEFIAMVKESGYPGMRILEYAFDPNDPGSFYMPFQYIQNSVVYTGTHDNDTLAGWISDPQNKKRIERAREYLGAGKTGDMRTAMLKCAYASVSDLAIVQMQDVLGLDSSHRTNDPSAEGNHWSFRIKKGSYDRKTAEQLKEWMLLYCRNNWNAKV